MESVLDDCLAQFSSKNALKEEQYQAVLGLLGRDKRMLWRFFPRGFWEKFNLPVVRLVKHKQKEKSVVLIAS